MLNRLVLGIFLVSGVSYAGLNDHQNTTDEDAPSALHLLQREVPDLRIHTAQDGRIDRLYGRVFATGKSAMDTADRFISSHAPIWGVTADDLKTGGVLPSGDVQVPLMFDPETREPRFTATYFSQWAGDFPVFASRLLILTLNRPDHGAVLAGADLRDLGDFEPALPTRFITDSNLALSRAREILGSADASIEGDTRVVVFAGYDMEPAAPSMGLEFVAVTGGPWNPDAYQKRRLIIDADGNVLYDENMVLSCRPTEMPLGAMMAASLGTVTGQVRANVTTSTAAAECDPEFIMGLPYAAVSANGTTVYADENGNFSHPHNGGNTSFGGTLGGQWFSVNNEAGSTTSASGNGSNGDTVNILYNSSPSELVTAQVNAYREANLIRDMVLVSNPSYPTIGTQTNWPINANISSTCNAFYDYSSINFYQAGGGCNNTAFSVIVHHEYGHHLVAEGGSGQSEYGEGMGDVMGVVLTGDSKLARGFYSSDCENGIRNADNSCQYSVTNCSSCGSAIHPCGQLLSGCVWDTWLALEASSPINAQEVIRDLSVNSILLHSGTSINDSITIDFITLDDTDGNIDNGSPHYFEIAEGFGAHGLDAPALALLSITAPDGLPDRIDPNGNTPVTIRIENLLGQLDTDSPRIYIGQDGSYNQSSMPSIGGDDYQGLFPAIPCGEEADYFFAATTTSGTNVYWPGGAPTEVFSAQASFGDPIISLDEDFETDGGFTASGSAADGQWTHGEPIDCDRGDPPSDFDGNNKCWLTDNSSANGCNSDVDDGTVYVTSPALDASEPGMSLCYARWFSNDSGAAPNTDTFVVEVSDDNGTSWMMLETVGPDGSEVSGGWFDVCYVLDSLAGFEPTSAMRVRFSTSDGASSGSVVEAAIDAISLSKPDCDDETPCAGDIDGDGAVTVDDVLAVISAFGSGAGGDTDGDGDTDVDDLLAVVAAFGPCP